jgi:ketosteroid isomerase-like protein
MKSDAFRRAVEALDLDATLAQMSETIVLHSPVKQEPLEGKEAVGTLFEILLRTFEDLRFVGTYESRDGGEILHFRWRLGGQEVEGIDMMHFDAQGLLEEYTVMVRPLPAVLGLRDAVFSQLPGA